MLRASEGLETLNETDHIHRSRCARYWKGRTKTVKGVGSQRATAQPEVKFSPHRSRR